MRLAPLPVLSLLAFTLTSAPAHAQDYLITVSGPYRTSFNDGSSFDGTNTTQLGPIFDISRLASGTFTATFLFQAITNPASGDFAGYDFNSPAGLSYDLLDAAGTLVHRGTSPSSAGAILGNNFSFGGGTPNDFINLYSFVNSVTGLITPTPLYSPTGETGAIQSNISISGVVGPTNGNADFITDLSIPLSASTLLSFPDRRFTARAYYGDGDFLNFEDPYQYIETYVGYEITSLSVTPIPEPSTLAFLLPALPLLLRRNRRHT